MRVCERRAEVQATPALLKFASGSSIKVRIAALAALEQTARDEHMLNLLDLLVKCEDDKVKARAMRTLSRLSGRLHDKSEAVKFVLATLPDADDGIKSSLFMILAYVAGKDALETVASYLGGTNSMLSDSAHRALFEWRGVEAASELLKIAGASEDLKNHVLAVRGFVRVVTASANSDQEKVGLLRQIMPLTRRSDEKKIVLAGLGTIYCTDSLFYIDGFVDDKDVGHEARLAAKRVLCGDGADYHGLFWYGKVDKDISSPIEHLLKYAENEREQESLRRHLDNSRNRFGKKK
jgi:hypothetical protein